MHPFIHDITKPLLDIVFPIYCLDCNQESPTYICEQCSLELALVPFQQCLICHQPSLHGITHPGCMNTIRPDGVISIFDYHHSTICKAIITGKYKFVQSIYSELTVLACARFTTQARSIVERCDYIVPIPLARARQRWRGFNQTETMALELSKRFCSPVLHALRRNRNTKTQKDLDQALRFKNVHGIFSLHVSGLTTKNIVLVDDVVTTGATLREATKTLKQAGAAQVWCLTLAAD